MVAKYKFIPIQHNQRVLRFYVVLRGKYSEWTQPPAILKCLVNEATQYAMYFFCVMLYD